MDIHQIRNLRQGNQTVDRGENFKNNFAGFNNDLKCTSMTGNTESKVISIRIASVKVKHEDGKDIRTIYAMFNNCRQGSFIHDNLVKKLGFREMETTFILKGWIPLHKSFQGHKK